MTAEAKNVDELPEITREHFKNVCRPGEGSACCRYVVVGAEGISCARHNMFLKVQIDARVEAGQFVATSDNCEGRKGVVPRGTG